MVAGADQSENDLLIDAVCKGVAQRRTWFLKRPADLLIALVLVILLLPLLVVIALLIKVDSRGPVLYSCIRLGKDGRTFRFYKFRSMYLNSSGQLRAIMESSPHISGEYLAYHKLRKDPRVTRVGGILRRFSLDELPQILNILRGDMSLIGPRPYLVEELPELEGREKTILSVRPGLTGLWQVSGRNRLSFEKRVELDVRYVLDWSVRLDIIILARTLPAVLKGDGAY